LSLTGNTVPIMFVGVSISNYRSIKKMDRPLDLSRFHVLVGPNASGKSTFLDAIDFVRDCLLHGPRKAVEQRVPEYRDLTWMRQGGVIIIILEFCIGQDTENAKLRNIYYYLSIHEQDLSGICVKEERLMELKYSQRSFFLGKSENGRVFYIREPGTYKDLFLFGGDRLALSHVPPDMAFYPTGNHIKNFILNGIRPLHLDSHAMRFPCPATASRELELDGVNLPRVVGRLLTQSSLEEWTDHLKSALPDLAAILWKKRESDNAEYLILKYRNGLECPSWLVSDGTLRILALTLLAFLQPESGIYLVEEPENGIHPQGVEVVMDALSSISMGQILVTTHSPFVVQQAGHKSLICFSRTDQDGTIIQSGLNHPVFKDWDGRPDLATIFSSGILG